MMGSMAHLASPGAGANSLEMDQQHEEAIM